MEEPMSRLVLAASLVVFIATVFATAQSEPRIVVGPNVYVSKERGSKLGEFHVAADPSNPNRLLAAAMTVPFRGNAQTTSYFSIDGGHSWNPIVLGGDPKLGGDPQVAFGRNGTAFLVSLSQAGDPPTRTIIYRSGDGGSKWAEAITAPFLDHPQIVVDQNPGSKFTGNIYMAGIYQLHRGQSFGGVGDYHLGVLRSTDDGKSWQLIEALSNHEMASGFNSSPSPLVFSDGELFIPVSKLTKNLREVDRIQLYEDGNLGDFVPGFITSKSGGTTYSTWEPMNPGGSSIGIGYHPHYAIDRTSGPYNDRIYAVWTDRLFYARGHEKAKWKAQLFLSYSSDRGKTWSIPQELSSESLTQKFMPTIEVNNEGSVAVGWYEARTSQPEKKEYLIDYKMTASINGGKSFLPSRHVSSEPTNLFTLDRNLIATLASDDWLSFMSGRRGYGHYYELAASADGTFHPVWQDGRTGSHQMWTARIRVENGPKAMPREELIEADVTQDLSLVADPLNEFGATNSKELPVRLRNKSKRRIYGPIKAEIEFIYDQQGKGLETALLNASNGLGGIGAVFDYGRTLRDLEFLPPGGISEAIVWRFKNPSTESEIPRVRVKITGRVEKQTVSK